MQKYPGPEVEALHLIDSLNFHHCVTTSNISHVLQTYQKVLKEAQRKIPLKGNYTDRELYFGNDTNIKTTQLSCCILYSIKTLTSSHDESIETGQSDETPCVRGPHEDHLKNLKIIKSIEHGLKFVLYSTILPCLNEETATFFRINIESNSWHMFKNASTLQGNNQPKFLEDTFMVILQYLKSTKRRHIFWKSFGAECLSVLLQLCFSPSRPTNEFYREYLPQLGDLFGTNLVIEHLILIQGIIPSVKGSRGWMSKSTKWMLLRWFLLPAGGVQAVLNAGLQMGDPGNWKRKEALATVICVSKHPKVNEFYDNLGSQIVTNIQEVFRKIKSESDARNSGSQRHMFHVLALAVEQITEDNPTVATEHVFLPLLKPLLITLEGNETESAGDDCDIGECIEILHKLFVETMSPQCSTGRLVRGVVGCLNQIAAAKTITHFKSLSNQILLKFLSQLESEDCARYLLVFCGLDSIANSPPTRDGFTFVFTPDSVQWTRGQRTPDLDDLQRLASYVMTLLEKLANSATSLRFYEQLSLKLKREFSTTHQVQDGECNALLTDAERDHSKICQVKRISLVASLLNLLSENDKIMADLFRDLDSAVPMLRNFIETGCQTCSDPDLIAIKESFSLNVVMLLMFYVKNSLAMKSATPLKWASLKEFLPPLAILSKAAANPAHTSLINELEGLILAQGVANLNPKPSTNIPKESKYKTALAELCSPLIPVRGHALIVLTRLLRNKNREALLEKDALLVLFKHHLKEEDTYIYLQAIEGLAVLCDSYHEQVVPVLTRQFVLSKKLATENRIKLIEVLTRATTRLGPMLPKYKNHFINALLQGCRDEDEFIRASSLSNLGEVCQNLKFSLGSIVNEIFVTIYDAITCERFNVVRRAGVLVITLILRGLDKDMFKVLQDILLKLYRFLKTLLNDQDDVIKLQAQLAMEEIDASVKTFLIPKITNTKKIFITDIPHNH